MECFVVDSLMEVLATRKPQHIEGQYLGPVPLISPENKGEREILFRIISCVVSLV